VQTNIPGTPFNFNVPQQPPTGFKSQFATITFDGAGTLQQIAAADIWTEPGRPQGRRSAPTRSPATVRSRSTVGSVVSGHLNADGSTFLLDQQAGHFPNIVVGIKN